MPRGAGGVELRPGDATQMQSVERERERGDERKKNGRRQKMTSSG